MPTDQTPQTLKSGEVDAIVAWQPNSGQALKELPGSKPIFTSKDVPGIIYDVLAVNPKSLQERRADWLKVVKVWGRIADYLKDPKNLDDAAKIMSARVGLSAEEYKPLMTGTYFLNLEEGLKHFQKGDDLSSVYFSSKTVDDFQLKNAVYKTAMPFEQYLDASLVEPLPSRSQKISMFDPRELVEPSSTPQAHPGPIPAASSALSKTIMRRRYLEIAIAALAVIFVVATIVLVLRAR